MYGVRRGARGPLTEVGLVVAMCNDLGLNFYTTVPEINYPGKYERRLFKYSKRGFGVCLAPADWERVNMEKIEGMLWEEAKVRCA
jgi:hypothetical protein